MSKYPLLNNNFPSDDEYERDIQLSSTQRIFNFSNIWLNKKVVFPYDLTFDASRLSLLFFTATQS